MRIRRNSLLPVSPLLLLLGTQAHASQVLISDDFESGYGNWSNTTLSDSHQWTLTTNGTPSSGTGPSGGGNNSTYFLYLETSSGSAHSPGNSAILESSTLSGSNIQLSFQAHAYGSDIGTLSVDVLVDGNWITDVWTLTGQQQTSNAAPYNTYNVDLSAHALTKIRFRAVAAGGFRGDIALDNIVVSSTPSGPLPPYFNDSALVKTAAHQNYPYSGSIAADATDPNGDALTFRKISGPDWLQVNSDGTLSGTPTSSDVGDNRFVVETSDGTFSAPATLDIFVHDATVPIVISEANFETDTSGWINVTTGDNKNWTRDSGGTTSQGTGPATGADNSEYYMYLETSSGFAYANGDSAILESPELNGNDLSLTFQYHMYGSNIGSLAVDVFSGGIWLNDIWKASGQQHGSNASPYKNAEVDLSNFIVDKVRLRATAAGGYRGDIAVDNIRVSRANIDTNDLDSDGIPNDQDLCQNTPPGEPVNSEGCSLSQIDTDNDGVVDSLDAFPNDPNEWLDTDGDGIGNNTDTDDDNDTVLDVDDAFPLNPLESVDTDGDGTGNNADTDDDNDNVPDNDDDFPLDPSEHVDTDQDGIGNNADTDDDNDGVADNEDALPLNPNESVDTDNDGIGNNADTDDDNDGVADNLDAFPLDPSENLDSDHDGIGNNADMDDDNDGVADVDDAFPFDSTESVDTDSDGIGNNADTDDDNDGVEDALDAFPLDNNESLDTDNDGVGNNTDLDDDNDGLSDDDEINRYQTNPLLADSDSDGMPDGWEVQHRLKATTNDAAEDPDQDGITNLDEYQMDTDPSPPVVFETLPADQSVDVSSSDAIVITLSEDIAADSVNASSLYINDGVQDVAGTISVDKAKITFTPDQLLQSNQLYTAVLTQDIADLAGNSLLQNYQWTFTTQSSYKMSGSINFSGAGLEGVSLAITGQASTNGTSDSQGEFSIDKLEPGQYTITPSKLGYMFTPASINIEVADQNIADLSFEAVTIPVIHVPADFATIQSAIDSATEGATILVQDGSYHENLVINKTVSIESQNGYASTEIIAANNNTHVISISAPHVKIKGFDISGAHVYYKAGIYFGAGADYGQALDNRCGYDDAHRNYIGISIRGSHHVRADNNICNHWGLFGIYVDISTGTQITNNSVADHSMEGISLDECQNCLVSGNTVTRSRTGIRLRSSSDTIISNNNSSSNTENGIHLINTQDGNKVVNNITESNPEVGIYVESTGATEVEGNTVKSNDISGIVMYKSSNCLVKENTVERNDDYGIYINNSDNCNVLENSTLRNGAAGIKLNFADGNQLIGNDNRAYERIGIELYQSNNNLLKSNKVTAPITGLAYNALYLLKSFNNLIYLNHLEGSSNGASVISNNGSVNLWQSPSELAYLFGGQSFTGFLGNYYGEHALTDSNGDGVTDNSKDLPGDEPDDTVALSSPPSEYQESE
ncbi:NosD domain-containing protein [Pleionea sp. CnH1-48]|uniref:NosD domain-containing protein n=1 Tax=Pleionea sp. CnH1-48 TaxID=2954494 RepID=UPI0020979F3B|nr:NosD domain-containing protein [Pleionea sp. CnH1-48]MCO7226022.1 right-handed parallel beta-helix repeat-containing protein [Pleionea sp. CnH1-48]